MVTLSFAMNYNEVKGGQIDQAIRPHNAQRALSMWKHGLQIYYRLMKPTQEHLFDAPLENIVFMRLYAPDDVHPKLQILNYPNWADVDLPDYLNDLLEDNGNWVLASEEQIAELCRRSAFKDRAELYRQLINKHRISAYTDVFDAIRWKSQPLKADK